MTKSNGQHGLGACLCLVLMAAGIGLCGYMLSYFHYRGECVNGQYDSMCRDLRERILLRQDKSSSFCSEVTSDIDARANRFRTASVGDRAREYELMCRAIANMSYMGIRLTPKPQLSCFPMRERYEALERSLASRWQTLVENPDMRNKWNLMVDKIDEAESAIEIAEQAISLIENISEKAD